MKRQIQTKFYRAICLGLTVALLPLSGRAVATTTTATDTGTVSSPSNSTTTAPDAKLTAPTREVVKLVNSGVPEGVVKAYVQNSPSTFNLTTDMIIHLRGMGVSEGVVVEMLSHDKALRDNAWSAASTTTQPSTTPQTMLPTAPYTSYGQPQDNGYVSIPSDYYDQSVPYGDYSGYYGYGYNSYYPWWGYAGWGWGWWPGLGWTWCPRSHFRDFDHRFGSRSFAGNRFNRGFNGGFNHTRTFSSQPFGVNHSFSSFHGGFNGGIAMGHSGGGHMGMGGGGHGGGGGGHR